MSVVDNVSKFNEIDRLVGELIDRSKSMPELVIKKNNCFYLYISFDEIFTEEVFDAMCKLNVLEGMSSFWLSVVDPDPKLYFHHYFKSFASAEFSKKITFEDYLLVLNEDPGGSPADAIIHNSNKVILTSSSGNWSIYGERDSDLAVCCFESPEMRNEFESFYEGNTFGSVKDAAIFAYGNSDMVSIFCKNYR